MNSDNRNWQTKDKWWATKRPLHLLFFSILSSVICLLSSETAFAQCQPIYGGGITCTNTTLVVSKTIFNPSANTFVHDMGVTDQRFAPNDQVIFHITVANTGNKVAQNVNVFDVVPQFVASTNPAINNGGNTTIEFNAGDLAPGMSQTFTVTATLDPAGSFPANQAVVCLNNQAQATDGQGDHAQDFSQFCIQNAVNPTGLVNVTPTPVTVVQTQPSQVVQPVPPTSTIPPTGADSVGYLMLIPTGLAGMYVRKFAEKMRRKK